MFENVVVGVGADEEAGEDAIALAKQLLSERGRLTPVQVLVVAGKPSPDSGSMHAAARHRRAVEELTRLAQRFAIATAVSGVEAPSVRRGLHEFALAHHADLLVISARRTDEALRHLAGSDTLEVLDDAPCPVAVAPAGYAARAATIRRIGVGHDRSAQSEQALTLARSLASDCDAELSAFEALTAPRYPHDAWDVRGELDHHLEEARQLVSAAHASSPLLVLSSAPTARPAAA